MVAWSLGFMLEETEQVQSIGAQKDRPYSLTSLTLSLVELVILLVPFSLTRIGMNTSLFLDLLSCHFYQIHFYNLNHITYSGLFYRECRTAIWKFFEGHKICGFHCKLLLSTQVKETIYSDLPSDPSKNFHLLYFPSPRL